MLPNVRGHSYHSTMIFIAPLRFFEMPLEGLLKVLFRQALTSFIHETVSLVHLQQPNSHRMNSASQQ